MYTIVVILPGLKVGGRWEEGGDPVSPPSMDSSPPPLHPALPYGIAWIPHFWNIPEGLCESRAAQRSSSELPHATEPNTMEVRKRA